MRKTIDLEWTSFKLSILTNVLDNEIESLPPGEAADRIGVLTDVIREQAHALYDSISKREPIDICQASGGKE